MLSKRCRCMPALFFVSCRKPFDAHLHDILQAMSDVVSSRCTSHLSTSAGTANAVNFHTEADQSPPSVPVNSNKVASRCFLSLLSYPLDIDEGAARGFGTLDMRCPTCLCLTASFELEMARSRWQVQEALSTQIPGSIIVK